MKRKITTSVKEIQAAKKAARAEKAKTQLHPFERKSDEELIRLNLQLSTYLLNLPGGKNQLTDKDKEDWKLVRLILKKRGVNIPPKVVPHHYSKEVLSFVAGV